MSAISVELPNSLQSKIFELSKSDGISANQFLVIAAAEKVSALMTENFLESEASKGKREHFERVMNAVPSIQPEPYDHLPLMN